MAVSSSEYWSVIGTDGVEVALNQYAWSVQSYGGSSRGLPPLRGEDQVYANRAGQSFRPKVAAARTIVLEMFVNGIDPDTDGISDDPDLQFNENLAALQRLFWTPSEQIQLVRRWRTASGMQTATAKAQIAGTMDPDMTGRSRATFNVELLLADPYFYSDPATVEIPVTGGEVWIDYPGQIPITGYGCYLSVTGAVGWPAGRVGDPGFVESYSGFMVQAEYHIDGVPRPDVFPTQYLTYAAQDSVVLKDRGIPAGSTVELSLHTSSAVSTNHLLGYEFSGVVKTLQDTEVRYFVPNYGYFPTASADNTAPPEYPSVTTEPLQVTQDSTGLTGSRPIPPGPFPAERVGIEVSLVAGAALIAEAPTAPWVDWDMLADGTPVQLTNVGPDYYDLGDGETYYLAGVDRVAQKFGLSKTPDGIPDYWPIGGTQKLAFSLMTVPEPFPVTGYWEAAGAPGALLLQVPPGGQMRLTLRDPLTGEEFDSYGCDGNAEITFTYRVPWV